MQYIQNNMPHVTPRDTNLKLPLTQAEFQKLGYRERVQLLRQHPDVYQLFAEPHKKKW